MLRKAKVSDVKVIHRMINHSSNRNEMLPRSLMDLYGSLRDFLYTLTMTDPSPVSVPCISSGKIWPR